MTADTKSLVIKVSGKVHQRVQALANSAGVSLTAYSTLLFDAAYAARCGETGDIALDTAVGRVGLLFGTGFDAESIRSATGLSEVFVDRTIEAWRSEMRCGSGALVRTASHGGQQ